jgi:CheY-like chemotaxis protein
MAGITHCGTILVVDDNVDIRVITKGLLEIAGYTVLTAADGEEGLRCYEQHRSTIVLLLTDVAMPKMNGFELADRVLATDSHMPVLFMSGEVGFTYGGSECLAKPFRPAQLIATVGRALCVNENSKKTASAA